MNYPTGCKKYKNHNINFANRGMGLENDLNMTNQYYIEHDIAYIYKKPTPIKITKVDYPNRNKAIIKEAFFMTPSTTDYNGLYRGQYIDFEAKETKNKISFPLSNIHKHQLEHIRHIICHGGIAFLIVNFYSLNKTFLLKGESLIAYVDNINCKNIPLSYFLTTGYEIKYKLNPRLDYLRNVDEIYFGGQNEKN